MPKFTKDANLEYIFNLKRNPFLKNKIKNNFTREEDKIIHDCIHKYISNEKCLCIECIENYIKKDYDSILNMNNKDIIYKSCKKILYENNNINWIPKNDFKIIAIRILET